MDKKRILFIRIDRLGDLVCTLPVDQHPSLKDWEITWFISSGLGYVTQHAQPQRQALEVDKAWSWASFNRVRKLLQVLNPDRVVVFHAPWWISLILWLCRVPERIGPKSQWHSFLFLNRTVRQKRRLSTSHEAVYNQELLEVAMGEKSNPLPPLTLKSPPETEKVLSSLQLTPSQYIVVHPGMGGSALNWPHAHYIELIKELTQQFQVVITGTTMDEPWLKPLREELAKSDRVHWLIQRLSGVELITVLEKAHTVIAPSTGVLHIAASTGVKTLGLFSPIRVQTTTRWGPRGSQAHTFTPQVDCPAQTTCLEQRCSHYPCMSRILPREVIERV